MMATDTARSRAGSRLRLCLGTDPMTLRVAIHHKTRYCYDRLVTLSPHVLRLRPAPHSRTPIHSYSLKIAPANHFINWQQDPFGNYQARLVFPEKARELSFEVEVIADMTVFNPFDFFVEDYAANYPFEYDPQLRKDLVSYLVTEQGGPLFDAWVRSVADRKMAIIDFLVMVNQRLQKETDYALRFEPGVQVPEETLRLQLGSCRDSGWLLVQILRHLGLAARFASGYLVQLRSDFPSLAGPSGPEQDFTDLHAWCEVYIPGAGWIGLDPTSGLFAGEGHIPLACTPDPLSAAPITGATSDSKVTFSYSNEVTRIHEDPGVTRPYSDDQWQCIDALGRAVDAQLAENDVRLTMGGEPTFMSIDDMDAGQWSTDAFGADKLTLANDLLLRLRDHFAPLGLLHYEQGQWYPGEAIPRWSLGCLWRADDLPLWREPDLLARVDLGYGFGIAEAEQFIHALGQLLGVGFEYVCPAFEDTLYYLWRERSLPAGVDPLRASLDDGLERMRLARVLAQGLETPTGYVLPLGWDYSAAGWYSSHWKLKAGQVVLIPGDSPMGLRLPLESLSGKSVEEPEPVNGGGEVLRTALCVQPRDGRLHVFLPPVDSLDHYISLLHLVERAAATLNLPVVIEGYEPPRDSRLQKLLITAGRGAIKVKIHAAGSWPELVDNTAALHQQAHLCSLGTEKFLLDGRHTGTGGGNHVTLGGATPADSPLLRRPDLLRSLVTYWQHHPGLSYLFSGLFIGPASPAPRIDEGRQEMLYELEVAFQQMPSGLVDQPWLGNLLVDVSGNALRAEFCIDKLYPPDNPAGRQGIVEFRGFEMPPHPRMALVQLLLLRCLVARFWREPYHKPLVRWGTSLHDRFMLPHYVWQDIKDVVEDLNRHGYPFELDWLRPFEEFRFPHYGRLDLGDIGLELRWAIEPWQALGEAGSSVGSARYLDSSVERLQVRVKGLVEGRYVVACNGRRIPLSSTGRHGEYVAGVRYRAWQPPSALHPAIGIHAPLVFDIIDTWNGRAIGGCTYHVSHAGGRNYETLPVNAFEAEARRVSRFDDQGHTPGPLEARRAASLLREFFVAGEPPRPMSPPPEEPLDEYPHTLDLRRQPG